jgi:hypothetical protein
LFKDKNMVKKTIKPPNSISLEQDNSIKVFLGGSIEMGKAENWQERVENALEYTEKEFRLFNPRRDDWDNSWEQTFENPQFSQQVNWELNALEKSDIVIMYFDPNTKSPISLLELGLFAKSGKLLVCCADGFWRKGNVDIVCEKYDVPLFDNLETLIKHIINK